MGLSSNRLKIITKKNDRIKNILFLSIFKVTFLLLLFYNSIFSYSNILTPVCLLVKVIKCRNYYDVNIFYHG